jgi:hypothetical protein
MEYYPDIYQIEQHVLSIVVLPTAPAEESGALAVNTEQLRTEPKDLICEPSQTT